MSIPLHDRIWMMTPQSVDILNRKLILMVRKDPELRADWLESGRTFVAEMNKMAAAFELEQQGYIQLMHDHESMEDRRLFNASMSELAESWSMANSSEDDQLWCESHAY